MPSFLKKILLATGIGLWLAGAAWGMKWMADYSLTPGTAGAPARDWPAPDWPLAAGRSTVVVGLHPECPCSRATLAELDSILLEGGDAIEAILIFSDTVPEEPAKNSALYRQAAALPRTRLVCATSAAELRRFAFRTSGETRLYRPDGRLVFRGGITGSRGHVGDNPGRDALVAALHAGAGERPAAVTPVFGCGFGGEYTATVFMLPLDDIIEARIQARTAVLEADLLKKFWSQTDRAFAVLLVLQWLAGIGVAIWLTPLTWVGRTSEVHVHVWAAIGLGGLIALPAAFLAIARPGRTSTRHVVAVAQMLASALLIHLTGGRIETHFHVFGSLAFIAFYRDWRILLTSSAVVAIDHFLRGVYWPQSVFGSEVVSHWRWIEHAGWVVFEDIFLIYSCLRSRTLIWEGSRRRAEVEVAADRIELAVVERTRELAEANARLEATIEVRRLAEEELKAAKETADAASQAKSEFLANMSHEIRTPMNGVMGMTSLLLDTAQTEQQRGFTETIRQSCDSLMIVINDILDLSKIESGKMELEEQPFDLRGCVEDTLDLFSQKASEKKIDLGYLLHESLPLHVVSDASRLRQVLVNLVGNALKFTEQGSVLVKVSGRTLGGAEPRTSAPAESWHELTFEVRDTGIGIPADRLDRLFKHFSQVDSSMTRRYGGTGLGLVISKRIVEIMGGDIRVESVVGQGSTFAFSIRVRAANSPQVQPDLPLLRGRHLLIVDDGEVNRRILRVQAERWGMQPHEVASGAEALAWLEAGSPADVAILDMQMPGMDGLDLAARIHAVTGRHHLPLVLLSSATGMHDRSDPGWLHFAARFNKPVKFIPLRDALLTALGQQAATTKAAPRAAVTKLAREFPLRILLAEDNMVNQKVAVRFLELMGYRCDVASDGREALDSLLRQPYDVVLMDVQMPEMNGYEVTGEVRRRFPPDRQPQIIALTAHASAQDRDECLGSGMNDYLTKPVSAPLLEQKLRDAATRLGRIAVEHPV